MKRLRILCISLITLAALLLPYAGFAQSADSGPEWNIRIEYRYTKGKEKDLNIPNTITRFGQNYYLISKQAPVLESTLPATRTYEWHIEGVLTEEEKKIFEESEGVVLTRTEVEVERSIDKVVSIGGLKTNEVDAIPFTESFEVDSATSPTGVETKEFKRTAVRFEVEGVDVWGLPDSYKATVVYRTFETYASSEFYKATSTYTTVEELEKVPQYVIVATYAPESILGISTGTGTTEEDTVVTPPIDLPDAENENVSLIIPNGQAPESSGQASAFKFWTLIPVFVAAVFAFCCFRLLNKEYKRRKENDKKRAARREAALRSKGLVNFD